MTPPDTPDTGTPDTADAATRHAFQAETRQLLDIVIHSLYSEKEIFLRELISNASDALDRLRFEALTEPKLLEKGETLEIRLEPDAEKRTLTIADNGVGMNREEVIENLGTIAKSGTRELVARMRESGSAEAMAELIGQFGVGFYSAFMVADRVTVVTRRAGEEKATRWESDGAGEYSLADDHRFRRGTTVTLHLKPVDEERGLDDFTRPAVLRRIVKRYSDFVAYPIVLREEREETVEGSDEKRTVEQDVTVNSMKPLWARPRSEVSDQDLAELYKHVSHDWNDPLESIWFHAEGRIEYTALLFVPKKAPFDLYMREPSWGLRLYVRRVLIMERCEELLPPYLRFVRGVVESADLPLNVSREMIQQDRHILQMRRWLTRKVLEHLGEMRKNEPEKYLELWRELGRVIKEGVPSDHDNRERLVPLLLFPSSRPSSREGAGAEGELTTLDDYVARMQTEQEAIYYLAGESREAIEASPHLEIFRERGVEVLYLADPVDELAVEALGEHQEKPFRSAAQGEALLGSEEERKQAEEELKGKREEVSDLLAKMKAALAEEVEDVRLSTRLTSSPACLVGHEHDLSPHLERLLRQSGGAGLPTRKRILEINPKHELLARLEKRFAADAEDATIADAAHLLHGYALLAEGSELPDPQRFNRLLADLMVRSLAGTEDLRGRD